MISNQLARLYYVVCRLILGLYSTSAHVCTCVVCVCFDTGYLIYHYHNLRVDVSGKHVCVCNCSYSHCTIIAANHSKGPFHRVKAVSVVECWTVCVVAGESFVNLTSLMLQLLPHHCPLLTAAERRCFLMLALPQHSLLGLVYRDH